MGCYCNKLYDNGHRDINIILKAIDSFEKACTREPKERLYRKNVIIVASKAKKPEICRKYWNQIIADNQMNNDDKYDYAAFCMLNKDFEGFHKYFDSRFQKENNCTPFPKYLFENGSRNSTS